MNCCAGRPPERRPGGRFPALLLLGALMAVLSGCAVREAVRPPLPVLLPPEAVLRQVAVLPPATTLTASARLELRQGDQPVSLRVALMLRKPALLRLETIPLLGPPDFFLSIAAGELRVFLPQQEGGRFYIGRATPENLRRFFPLAFPPEEMVSLLMGELHGGLEDPAEGGVMRGEAEPPLYRIDQFRRGERYRSLWIDPDRHLLVRAQWFGEGGRPSYTVSFTDHAPLGDGQPPRGITVAHPSLPGLALRYRDLQTLPEDAPAPFALPLPEGLVPIPLD